MRIKIVHSGLCSRILSEKLFPNVMHRWLYLASLDFILTTIVVSIAVTF